MEQLNENLQSTVPAGEYLAPMIKVMEIRTCKVLCASNDGFNLENDGAFSSGGSLDE